MSCLFRITVRIAVYVVYGIVHVHVRYLVPSWPVFVGPFVSTLLCVSGASPGRYVRRFIVCDCVHLCVFETFGI